MARRRILKVTGIVALSVIALVVIGFAAFYLRLAFGPVPLNFLTESIQTRINQNLAGMTVRIEGALVERNPANGIPQLRLQGVVISDEAGNEIARAPKAAIGIDETTLFTGIVVPRSLELIGPSISLRRNLEGGMELGFGSPAAPETETIVLDDTGVADDGKSDQVPAAPTAVTGAALIDILSGGDGAAQTTVGSIAEIRVSAASLTLLDEANDSVWRAPVADLAFRRMPYGFTVLINAKIANGLDGGSWRTEISASYRRDSKSFSISATINDLIPANISDKIFALSQLARVKLPLSGQAEIEVSDRGVITKASAQFSAAAGEVGLPDYFSDPIIVDEGSLRATYDPATGGVRIADSVLLVGGSRAELTGNILPVRGAGGRLSALQIDLEAQNVAIDAQGTIKSAVLVDSVKFSGLAAVDVAKLDIKDLVVMSGSSGVRLRGTITGGDESAGIALTGRIRDISAALLKRLWPPVMAPKTRSWVNSNISAGRITEGQFEVNLAPDALAQGQRIRKLPAGAFDLKFKMAGVTTGYFKKLPPLQNASGEARLKDNDFTVSVNGADIVLPSGQPVRLDVGRMEASNIIALEPLGVYTFEAKASAQSLLEYLDLPDLSVIRKAGVKNLNLGGTAALTVVLKMPMIKDAPKERVEVSAKAVLSDASLRGALPKIDITHGKFEMKVENGRISAVGPARINGVDAKIAWRREAGANAKQSVAIEAVLDGDERKKIGVDLSEFLRGITAIKAVIEDLGDPDGKIAIEANLAKAEMRIGAINWVRPPQAKTSASLVYYGKGKKGRRVEKLEITGPGVVIKGEVGLTATGDLREALLSEVRLGEENLFALSVKSTAEATTIDLAGDSFDARPLVKSMFSPAAAGAEAKAGSKVPQSISATVNRVYVNRGEIITGVKALFQSRGGKVESAEISGNFLSGQPIVLRVVPVSGGRELRVTGRDGGAALRAADLYSKVAGGAIDFFALLGNDAASSVRQGKLVMRNFEVRNEAALAQLDTKGKPKKSGPRRDGIAFRKLTLPFTTDAGFVRIGDAYISGDELCAGAQGLIRKADSAIDIQGTIIPACAPNAVLGNIPLLGDILTGGGGEGIFGVTYALGGSMKNPVFQVNPISAIAPGIFRKLFEFNGSSPSRRKPVTNGG